VTGITIANNLHHRTDSTTHAKINVMKLPYYYIHQASGRKMDNSKVANLQSIFNKSQELITLRNASKFTKDMELASHDCQLVYGPDEAKYLYFMGRIR
jgi:ABC-type uncharacterized transport system ATPase subunit